MVTFSPQEVRDTFLTTLLEQVSVHTWLDSKVCELIAVEVLHTSLLNTTVVAFKVLPLGSYAPMPVPSPPFKTILELVLWWPSELPLYYS